MDELISTLNEFKTDYNQTHFVRNASFKAAADSIQGPARKIFIEFLERSCTAEFSGFLLYKELGRRLKKSNPAVAEVFTLMSRDEARHAGFLNKAMSDFNLALDLGFLTKNRKYTFFKVSGFFSLVPSSGAKRSERRGFLLFPSSERSEAKRAKKLSIFLLRASEQASKAKRRSCLFSFFLSFSLSLFLPSFLPSFLSFSLPAHFPTPRNETKSTSFSLNTLTAQVHHLRDLSLREDRLLALHLDLPPPAAQPQPRHVPALRVL